MASRFSLEAIFKAVDQFSKPLVKMINSSSKFTKTLRKDFAKAQRDAMQFTRNFGQNMKRAFQVGIGIAVVGMGLLIKKGIELASALTEVQNVVDTTFEESSKIIDKWSKTAITQFGLSELQAKQFSSTIGAMIKPAGISGDQLANMSTKIASLSGDIASFRDLEPDEVFKKLQSIVTGTVKPLTSLGIVMTVANLEAFALSKGITKSWKSMTQAEKVMLRYNFVLERTKDMQGDYNKTLATSFANQQRTLKIKFFDKLARAMKKLIPMLIKGAEFLSKLLDKIDEEKLAIQIASAVKSIVNFAKGLWKVFKIIKPFIPLVLSMVAGFILYKKVLFAAALAQQLMTARMNPIVIAIGLLIFAIFMIIKNWKKFNKTQKAVIITIGSIVGAVLTVIGVIKAVILVYKIWQVVQIALNVAMTANPIGIIIVGIGALIAAIVLAIIYYKEIIAFTKKWWEILKFVLKLMFPFISVLTKTVDIIKLIVQHWNHVKEAFKTKGILGGILAIGKAILSGILAPIISIFELLAKIPKIGKKFEGITTGLKGFQTGLFEDKTETPITPSERSSLIREEKISKGELTIKDETGRGELNAPRASDFKIELISSGEF